MKKISKIFQSEWLLPCLATACLSIQAHADSNEITRKLTIKSFVDLGHLVNGDNPYGPALGIDRQPSMLPLNRTGVTFIQETALNRFDIAVGLTGLIWWPYGGGVTDPIERVMNVKPMIPVARARWQFGSPSSVAGALQVGTFSYKYNPDAKDLGEYLYRSGTYPGFLTTTEGWLLMNRASNYSHGALLALKQFDGKLSHNFSLFMETQYYPIGDFSPGYDFSFTQKWFEVGGGVVLNHYLSSRPSALTPTRPENTYITGHVKDSNGTVSETSWPQDSPPADTIVDTLKTGHWTLKGVKLMGRAALNLGSLLPESIRGSEDLRIFTEVAVLGVKNYPIYYNKLSRRMPVMFGINLPTAKILDVLSLQAEHYSSLYNDIDQFSVNSLPVWQTTNGDSITRDDWKWSVYGKKTVNKLITVYSQVANDHFRLTDGHYKVSNIPLTSSPSDWYYLIRLEFALR